MLGDAISIGMHGLHGMIWSARANMSVLASSSGTGRVYWWSDAADLMTAASQPDAASTQQAWDAKP